VDEHGHKPASGAEGKLTELVAAGVKVESAQITSITLLLRVVNFAVTTQTVLIRLN
jgi:hypothetical protein